MVSYPVKIADAIWVATAMLHESEGVHASFSKDRICDQVVNEIDSSKNVGSIMHNISVHCLANRPAKSKSDNHCKLYMESKEKYRLYRTGEDDRDPSRRACSVEPDRGRLLPEHHKWIDWYRRVYCGKKAPSPQGASGEIDTDAARSGRAAAGTPDGASAKGHSGHAGRERVGTVDVLGLKGGPPPWATEAVTRAVRNTAAARSLKSLYEDRCQVCGRFIQVTPDRRYSEVHHLRPLGLGGDDAPSNMLVLCPTHHVEFDYAVLGVSGDGRGVVDKAGGARHLNLLEGHSLGSENVMFQLDRMGLA